MTGVLYKGPPFCPQIIFKSVVQFSFMYRNTKRGLRFKTGLHIFTHYLGAKCLTLVNFVFTIIFFLKSKLDLKKIQSYTFQ